MASPCSHAGPRATVISVIITAFDSAAYIGQAIESVLAQTLPADEMLVIDDGSSDTTPDVVRRYQPGVSYRWQRNQGAGSARNLGIRESKGDLLAFLDADDLWLPDKLRLQNAAMEEDPALDLVFTHMSQFRDDGPAEEEERTVHPSPLISCMLARRTAFERVGDLRTDLNAEFVEWYLRAREAGLKLWTLDALLVRRRIHSANFTLLHRDLPREYIQSLKASLDRRRAKASGSKRAGAGL
jgi:glycosyltransferase involved in cell wall biosynthesis